MQRVLVTGATGFVGRVLCDRLMRAGRRVRAAVRGDPATAPRADEIASVGDMVAGDQWEAALRDVDAVVHTAGRAHLSSGGGDDAKLFTAVNAHATERLASAAVRVGVRRFVYLSTAKVNGEETHGRPFSPYDLPRPQDAYASSKYLGEQAVLQAGARSGMEVAVVRSPLVYGSGVRANFLRLLQSVERESVLPFGAVVNRRSLVSVWNLCDVLERLLGDPIAPGPIWMVSDGEDVSTADLVRHLAAAMGRRANLISVPPGLLYVAGAMLGRRPEIRRLCSSLVIDMSATTTELGWKPPLSLEESIARTVRWFVSVRRINES